MSERRVLLDTGPLVALLARSDRHHQVCVDTFARLRPPLLTCWPVLTEAAWLLRRQSGAVEQLAAAREAGMFDMLPLGNEDLTPIASIIARYQGVLIQFADAALVHLAEREAIRTVFTLDRRDFSIIRLKRNRSITLLPDLS